MSYTLRYKVHKFHAVKNTCLTIYATLPRSRPVFNELFRRRISLWLLQHLIPRAACCEHLLSAVELYGETKLNKQIVLPSLFVDVTCHWQLEFHHELCLIRGSIAVIVPTAHHLARSITNEQEKKAPHPRSEFFRTSGTFNVTVTLSRSVVCMCYNLRVTS